MGGVKMFRLGRWYVLADVWRDPTWGAACVLASNVFGATMVARRLSLNVSVFGRRFGLTVGRDYL